MAHGARLRRKVEICALSLTDGNGHTHEFLGEAEKEVISAKQNYYKWLSRLFIFFATLSLLVFMSSSLALFNLAPQVSVEPFLIIKQDASENIVRYEPISEDMASETQLMEAFIKQYVILRNTLINDAQEMNSRWMPGGMIHFLSSGTVFTQFYGSVEDTLLKIGAKLNWQPQKPNENCSLIFVPCGVKMR